MAAELLFWGSLGAVVYSYVLYPCIVALIVKVRGPARVLVNERLRPSVSMIVALYNEEGVLADKLNNLSEVEYPPEKLEFVLGSDGSTDRTVELLNAWDNPRKQVLVCPDRRGKARLLNDLVPMSTGEIVVFSDANTMYDPLTVARLVGHFADPRVGAVCGELMLIPEKGEPGGTGEVSYWSFENWLKKQESDYHTMLGASGAVYAIRRSLFTPLPADRSVADDFILPLRVVRQGYRVVYAREARAYEQTSGSMKGEFNRKARIGAQNFAGIADYVQLLMPGAGFVAFALWSHKIIRWCVPLLAILFIIASVLLAPGSAFHTAVLLLEIGFLALALAGYIAERRHIPLAFASLPYYVTSMNVALLVGLYRFLTRQQPATWEILR